MTNAERTLLRLVAECSMGQNIAVRDAIKEALAAMDAEAFWTQGRQSDDQQELEAYRTAAKLRQQQAVDRVIERDKDVLQGLADYDRAARRVPRYAPTHVSHGFDAPYPTSAAGRAAKAAGASPEPSGAHYDREPDHDTLKRAEQALINGWDVT